MSAYTVGILTVSDTASNDQALDKSGPTLEEILQGSDYTVEQRAIVPDDKHDIRKTVEDWSDRLGLHLILLTGGTGFAERDITPEAIQPLLTKETPGVTQLLLSTSLAITPFAALSRPVTGIRNKTLIITLPGSPKACKENMEAVLKILPHALDLLLDRSSVKKLHDQMQGKDRPSATVVSHHGGHQCVHRHDVQGHVSQTGKSVSLDTPVSRRARSSPYPLISVEDAKAKISEFAKELNVITVPVSQLLPGYVLAEDVDALEPVPGYRASVVDGYAVFDQFRLTIQLADDGPGTYSVESVSLAESSTAKSLSKGSIARITTGGMVPDGADAVVMVEDTRLVSSSPSGDQELEVEILVEASSGDNIREIGSDCAIGERVGRKGEWIDQGLLGTLASVGVRHVRVYRKPRVGVLSSGNEVQDHMHTDVLKPGQIRDTNRMTLISAIQSSGFEAVDLGIMDDSVEDMVEHLEEAIAKVDVLITTGGVSMGEADFMKPVLEQKLEATVHFGRVMMKPGKPTTFATVPQGPKRPAKLVFALAGNPVSATVGFYLFVLPALRQMAGWSHPYPSSPSVLIQHDILLDSRPEYHRVHVTVNSQGTLVAESTGKQQSSRMLSMKDANGLLELPMSTPDKKQILKGTLVPCILIGTLNS
ncbi:Gephyrin [Choanephora cucurbitarum]|uniref:Gephyrin n=1 Tax=Choanephora cucurbitarum TaxID=101091 RepID=A0A1C7N198_9FUNG|nr:Gephyrin [Choanephora cucurbitarum]